MELVSSTEIVYGKIIGSDFTIEPISARIRLDAINTDQLLMDSVVAFERFPIPFLNSRFEKFSFHSIDSLPHYEIDGEITFPFSTDQRRMISSPLRLTHVKRWLHINGLEPTSSQLSVYLSSSVLLRRRVRLTAHSERGLLYGWVGDDRPIESDDFNFEYNGFNFILKSGLLFGGEAEQQIVRDVPEISISLSGSDSIEKAIDALNDVLLVMSLIETRQISWTHQSNVAKCGDQIQSLWEEFQRIPIRRYAEDDELKNKTSQYRNQIPLLVKSLLLQNDVSRKLIEGAIRAMGIANDSNMDDRIRLMHWVIATEQATKLILGDSYRSVGSNLPDRLRVASKQLNVTIQDECFDFITIRNDDMHDVVPHDPARLRTALHFAREISRILFMKALNRKEQVT